MEKKTFNKSASGKKSDMIADICELISFLFCVGGIVAVMVGFMILNNGVMCCGAAACALGLMSCLVIDMKTEYLSKSQLKERGWTDGLIAKFLKEPDMTKQNPYYKCAAPMCLYDEKRITRAEKKKTFIKEFEKIRYRKSSANKAVETKRQKALQYARSVEIEVPVMDYFKVVKAACESYNDFHEYRLDFRFADPYESDERFLKRITENFLRHECTEYEMQLRAIHGKVGVQEAHDILQERINNEIRRVYPQLNK